MDVEVWMLRCVCHLRVLKFLRVLRLWLEVECVLSFGWINFEIQS